MVHHTQIVVMALCCIAATRVAAANPTKPPAIPQGFYGSFTEYSAPLTAPPPYINGIPDAPFIATRGEVYYDWASQAMIEKRLDYCVNIFPTGNNFTCIFHNVNKTSYLVTAGPNSPFPPCCVFGQPWFPPPPDFLQTRVQAQFAAYAPWSNVSALWWVVPSVAPPTGPFWYAFASEQSPQVYLSFSFPGVNGWVQQNFFNITYAAPDPAVFELPAQCNGGKVDNCGIDPGQAFVRRNPML